jgi:hypothetical protein
LAKKFERVTAIPKQQVAVPAEVIDIVQAREKKVVNLERVDLTDRENWLRALDLCKEISELSLDGLLREIQTYQGQIDQALQTAQAQSTIYAYAIGTRLDAIEREQMFEQKGHPNLTAFIKAGEVKRPSGQSITTRQVWAYRSVTRGLNEFLELAEEIRAGRPLSTELEDQLSALGEKVNQDIVNAFINSYSEVITGVLELGVSKLEQVYRLPKSVALSGLLSGKLALEEDILEMREIPFTTLRKAISSHEKRVKQETDSPSQSKKRQPSKDFSIDIDLEINKLDGIIKILGQSPLTPAQIQRLSRLSASLEKLLS